MRALVAVADTEANAVGVAASVVEIALAAVATEKLHNSKTKS